MGTKIPLNHILVWPKLVSLNSKEETNINEALMFSSFIVVRRTNTHYSGRITTSDMYTLSIS